MKKQLGRIGFISLSLVLLSMAAGFNTLQAQQRPERDKSAVPSETMGIQQAGTPATVKIWTDKGDNKNGNNPIYYVSERIYVSFQVNKDSYVTIYDIDSTGNVNILFPNQYHADNFVRGGRIYTIPPDNSGYDFIIKGPTGKEIVYALASTHVYYHWQYGQNPPPIWNDQWGVPATWGHPGGEDDSMASRRFQQRLQGNEEANLAALTLANLKKQLVLPATVGCAQQTQEQCQCNFYVTISPY